MNLKRNHHRSRVSILGTALGPIDLHFGDLEIARGTGAQNLAQDAAAVLIGNAKRFCFPVRISDLR